MEDKLYELAVFYRDKLNNRKFRIKAAKANDITEFDIVFNADRFKHLIGIHKAKDLPIYKVSSSNLFRRILNREIAYEQISKSLYFSEIEKRIEDFKKISEVLFSSDIMLKSLKGEFKKISADFLLSKKEEMNYVHLFLKKDADIVVPVSFFVHDNDYYIRNDSSKWTVLSVEEIPKLSKKDKAIIESIRKSTQKEEFDRLMRSENVGEDKNKDELALISILCNFTDNIEVAKNIYKTSKLYTGKQDDERIAACLCYKMKLKAAVKEPITNSAPTIKKPKGPSKDDWGK